jgi:putative ABC transport system permease protein
MLKNYFQLAFRNLIKNKIFSFINIFGLTIGLACCMLIAAFLFDELSFDKYPAKASQIYRVGVRLNQNGGVADYPIVDVAVGAGIKSAFPGVLASSRLRPLEEDYVSYGDKQFKEKHLALCDSNFLEMFSIPLIEGNPKTALTAPGSIVITKSFANKYFGNLSAMGKTLKIFGGVKVTGVIDKVPDNSHFHFDAFISMASNRWAMIGTTWSNIGFYTYLLLDKDIDPKKLESKFPQLTEKYVVPEAQHDMGVSLAEARKAMNTWHFYLIPVTDIHLHAATKYELEANGDIQNVYIFGALALFIMLLACVNFTNLSTASSAKRSREVGIRKVLGSVKKQLVSQFLTESVLLTCFGMFFALLLVYLLLPYFNQLSGKHISISFFLNYRSFFFALSLVLFVGIVAGIYPAFFLSSFNTIAVLKSASPGTTSKRNSLRSGLVIFQFMISSSLIIATVIIYQQLHFMQNKKLGYDKEQVLVIQDTYALHRNQEPFKQQLLKDSRVVNATISMDAPVDLVGTGVDGSEVYAKENKENETAAEIHAFYFHVDYDYLSTLGMKMAAGRYFSKDFASDSSAVVINESAVRDLGWTSNRSAIDKTVVSSGQHEYKVVGVVQDFNYASAKQKIAPLFMMLGHNYGALMVKIRTDDVKGFLEEAKKQWEAFNTEIPFSYYFLDDRFASLYQAEQKTGQVFTLFAILAIIIASLGLFGLVAFTTEQRTKEIGIRKVLGASVNQVLFLLSKKFLSLVCIAFVISIPLTWWAMHNWLNNFAYRISINWWVFLMAGLLAVLIALLTISFQAVKAALANPVKSLRTE